MSFTLTVRQYGDHVEVQEFATIADLEKEVAIIREVFTTFEILSVGMAGGLDDEFPSDEDMDRLQTLMDSLP